MAELDQAGIAALTKDMHEAITALHKKNDEISEEVKKFGSADFVSRDELKRIEADLDAKQDMNDKLMLAMKRMEQNIGGGAKGGEDLEAKAAMFGAAEVGSFGNAGQHKFDVEALNAYREANAVYLRKGDRSLSELEVKTLSVGGDPDGGYVVHPDMSGRTIKKVYETSVMRAYAAVQTISTDSLEGMYDNDEAGYGWVAEMGSRDETDTPQLGTWSIPVHEMYALPKATTKIIDDAAINIEAWLSEKISERFARAENEAFVIGDGVKKPRGFLDYPNGTDLTNSIERVLTGVNGDFAADPAGFDFMMDMANLKAPYLSNANWFMNRTTRTEARKLKTSDGAYLWQQSVAAGAPSTILGYSVAAAMEDMPAIATGSLSIAFGDMRSAYQIVDRLGIRVLRDPFTQKGKVLYFATKRTGGDLVNGEALKIGQFSAA